MASVSVVIPAHNLSDVIGSTVASVLGQTILPDEIIVIDDGSSDGTAEVVGELIARQRDSRLRLIRALHKGAGAARNRGIEAATGEWVSFLDGDDLWFPQKIERLQSAIAAHPEATMVAHDAQEMAETGEITVMLQHKRYDARTPLLVQLYRANILLTSSVSVRRNELLRVGGFDETLPASQDFELWLKLARRGHIVFIPEILETYRRRATSISSRGFERYNCVLRIAYRHAPHVRRIVGWRRAALLRLRLSLIAHMYAFTQRRSLRMLPRLAGIALRAPWELIRAIVAPMPVGTHEREGRGTK